MEQFIRHNGLDSQGCDGGGEKAENDLKNANNAADVTHQSQNVVSCPIDVLNVHAHVKVN